MAGRTLARHARVYANGYDISGNTRSVGAMSTVFPLAEYTGLSDGVRGYLPGQAEITLGEINGIFDNTATTGLHGLANSWASAGIDVMIPIGDRTAPAAGVPVFVAKFYQLEHMTQPDGEAVYANLKLSKYDVADLVNYSKAWGWLLHAHGAETGANSSTGIDDNGAATTAGGYMAYQIFAYSGTGSATITVQDAATNSDGDFANITSATTGAIAHTSMPCAGIVQLGTTATVRRYLRWQLSLSTLASVTFALAFVRG